MKSFKSSHIINDDDSSVCSSQRTVSEDLDQYEKSFIDDSPIDVPVQFLNELDSSPLRPFVNNSNLPDECFFDNFVSQPKQLSSKSVSPSNNKSTALVVYSPVSSPSLNSNKAFRFCASTVFLTYPQCHLSKEYVLEYFKNSFSIKSALISHEFHKDHGSHLHAWFQFAKKINSRNPRLFDIQGFHPNIGYDKTNGKKNKKRSKIDIFKYITKDGDFIQYNLNVKRYLKEYSNHKAHIADALINGEISLVNAVQDEPNLLFSLSNIQKNLNLYYSLKSINEFKSRRSFWLYGAPGIGKSFSIRKKFPDLYVKGQHRWWDGYINEKVVLLDDFDSFDLSHNLKIWSDNYIFTAEVKCGTITPSYELFFVTSNYDLNYFYQEPMLKKAMIRRFTIINCDNFLTQDGFFDFDSAFSSFNFK